MNKRYLFLWIILLMLHLIRQPVLRAEQINPIIGDKKIATRIEKQAEKLLTQMTLKEKMGQMVIVGDHTIVPEDVSNDALGGVLSGGDNPEGIFSAQEWIDHVKQYQDQALKTRLAIPIIYGVDAVHGHQHVVGATIFPHNIGLGATRNPELVHQIGQATAKELLATGISWNFAPAVSVPLDIRWGRTYEGFSENTSIVSELASAYIEGMQSIPHDYPASSNQTIFTGTSAKHFIGDGGTEFGTSTKFVLSQFLIDQGDMRKTKEEIATLFIPPYHAAITHNVMSVMASYNSWYGQKMHASRYWLTEVLKGQGSGLHFDGFVVSDWEGIDQISTQYDSAVVIAINAGIDMIMVDDHKLFFASLEKAINNKQISIERINDAVRRILIAKIKLGLFDHPFGDPKLKTCIGSKAHRQLALKAVRESLVLLKNRNQVLPLSKKTRQVFIAGKKADDMGIQCGGWTIKWQGTTGAIYPGTTILDGIRQAVPETSIVFDDSGLFPTVTDEDGIPVIADVGIAVVGEMPYAEGVGDRKDLSLSKDDVQLIHSIRKRCENLIVIIISGRPMIITDLLDVADAWIAAWLPGTEGGGIADVLFGDAPFTGRLPYTWPRSNSQIPINIHSQGTNDSPLFPYGFGL